MEAPEYERLAEVEDLLWYCRALRERALDALRRERLPERARVLEIGCGTGGFLRRVRGWRTDLRIEGLDLSPLACEHTRKRGFNVVEGAAEALPFASGTFDAIVGLDLLTQVESAMLVLVEIHRCLRPGGSVLLSGAALPWLWSYHDDRVQSTRRLLRGEVVAWMREAGFFVEQTTYWNCAVLPLVAMRRKLLPRRDGRSDVEMPSRPVNAALGALAWCERMVNRVGVPLPIGSSLFAVGRKQTRERQPTTRFRMRPGT